MRHRVFRVLLPVWGLLFFASCSVHKQVAYFQDVKGDTIQEIAMPVADPKPITLKPEDKISIVVNSQDPQLNPLFNLPITQPYLGDNSWISTNSREYVSVYTLDPQGNIDFPVLGNLHVEGMTRSDVASYIKNELENKKLLQNPVVTVEYKNLGFSVLGEVNQPGRFSIDQEHVTLLEGLSMAGDLTIHGRRTDITVLREENGQQKVYPVNLCSAKELYASPAYYLQQNDVVYVRPLPAKARQATAAGNTVLQPSFWISLASLFTTIAALIVPIVM